MTRAPYPLRKMLLRDESVRESAIAGLGEVWRLVDSDPAYEVSSEGRVRRVGGKVLRPWRARTGYLQVNLSKKRRVSVHRVVCEAFHGPANERQVNHINGDRADPRAVNLEWVTQSENMQHRYAVLGRAGTCVGKFSNDHPSSKPVVSTDKESGLETRYESGMDAVREGFRSDCISRCCTGKSRFHKGRYWRYAEAAA